jgi:hypothetical protein
MKKTTGNTEIPQLVGIAEVPAAGTLTLNRRIRQYLGTNTGPYYLAAADEILLAARKSRGAKTAQLKGKRLTLPESVQAKLAVQQGSRVAFIERGRCLALKAMVIQEKEGTHAYAEDVETPARLTRVAVTNPPPETLLPILQKKHAHKKVKHNVKRFLRGRPGLAAWQARAVIGRPDPGDAQIRKELIAERLDAQAKNGSWDDEIMVTARALKELAQLGVSARKRAVRRGAE